MVRISAIDDDWIAKGCHVHVGKVEVALRPNHSGKIVFRKVFSTTKDREVEVASQSINQMLQDPKWRGKLRDSLEGALDRLGRWEGKLSVKARSRSCEIQRLLCILKRWERT